VPAFSKERWPRDGAIRALLEYLDELHREAGQPSVRDISRAIGLSPSAISPFFTGTRLASKGNLELLVSHLGGDTAKAERLRKAASTEWNDSRSGTNSADSATHPKPSATTFTRAGHAPLGASRPVPRQLPAPPRWFVGRKAELRRLDDAILSRALSARTVGISAIGGMGGIGKTALSLHWAHQNIRSFPDGQLFINLRGFDPKRPPLPPLQALRDFLDALGVQSQAIPSDLETCAALYRSILADRRILVIADNANDFSQVAPLIPGSPSCAIIVTSRYQLVELRMRGASLLRLEALNSDESGLLLTSEISTERAMDGEEPLDGLIAVCGGLPLALEIVAGRATVHPEFPLRMLADELREASARLDKLTLIDSYGGIRAVFSWSYTALPAHAARAFRLIGIAPGVTIDAPALAALMNTDVESATAALTHLELSSLIYQYRPYRYRMHDLVRLYAAEEAARDENADEREDALWRVTDHYLYTAFSGDRLIAEHRRAIDLGPCREGAMVIRLRDDLAAVDWFTAEHSDILAAQAMAATNGWLERVWQFAWVLDSFHWRRGHLHEDIASWEAGLAAATRLGDDFAMGLAHRRLGRAYGRANRYDLALHHMMVGLSFAERAKDIPGQAHARRILSWVCHQLDDDETALHHASASLQIYDALGNPVWKAHALDELGICYLRMGRYAEAESYCSQALALHREHRHRAGVAESLDSLGNVMLDTGRYDEAIELYQEALAVYRSLDNTYDEANVLDHLAHALTALERPDDARQAWQDALSLYQQAHRITEAARVAQLLEEHS
jgi:tetratricopeptide (TPR) repeat protein